VASSAATLERLSASNKKAANVSLEYVAVLTIGIPAQHTAVNRRLKTLHEIIDAAALEIKRLLGKNAERPPSRETGGRPVFEFERRVDGMPPPPPLARIEKSRRAFLGPTTSRPSEKLPLSCYVVRRGACPYRILHPSWRECQD
jgi:hypothetical protein